MHPWAGLAKKQARRFSQFELKVGELGFSFHFVCVSAALYHRGGGGVRGRHFFPLGEYGPFSKTSLLSNHGYGEWKDGREPLLSSWTLWRNWIKRGTGAWFYADNSWSFTNRCLMGSRLPLALDHCCQGRYRSSSCQGNQYQSPGLPLGTYSFPGLN